MATARYVFPTCPQALKYLEHYMKIAEEHDKRDPVISYYCRFYTLQSAINADVKSPEIKEFSLALMAWLELQKKDGLEGIRYMVAGEAHVENYALKLFHHADNLDSNGQYGKNVMKTFYTAGMLFDVLEIFGELNEEITQKRKYAKWRAAYLFKCIKSGEVPEPSPARSAGSYGIPEDDEINDFEDSKGSNVPAPAENILPTPPSVSSFTHNVTYPQDPQYMPSNEPTVNPGFASANYPETLDSNNSCTNDTMKLNPEQITQAQKFCKWAGSALTFDDIPTAITNLEKALRLLKTGSAE